MPTPGKPRMVTDGLAASFDDLARRTVARAAQESAELLAECLDRGRQLDGKAKEPAPDSRRRGTVSWGIRTGSLRASLSHEANGNVALTKGACNWKQFSVVFGTSASAKRLSQHPRIRTAVLDEQRKWRARTGAPTPVT